MSDDPVLRRRARISRVVEVGQRLGYGLFGVAIVVFGAGVVTGWTDTFTTVVIGALLLGSVVLAPSIVLGYAVTAAEREDREQGRLPPSDD